MRSNSVRNLTRKGISVVDSDVRGVACDVVNKHDPREQHDPLTRPTSACFCGSEAEVRTSSLRGDWP